MIDASMIDYSLRSIMAKHMRSEKGCWSEWRSGI